MARVALVTGGTRGIGAAISTALKASGRTVVASYAGNDAAAALSPSVRRAVLEHGVDPATVKGTGKDGRLTKEDVAAAASAPCWSRSRSSRAARSRSSAR